MQDVIRQVLHQTTTEFEKAHRRYGSPPYAAACRYDNLCIIKLQLS